MAVYKDEKNNTWFCKFYYEDVNGNRKQKKKRGFKLRKEALEWERNFLESKTLDLDIKFKNFLEQYYRDIESRLKESTLNTKRNILDTKILPYFGEMILSEIKPIHVRDWQNELLTYRDANGKPYAETYLKTVHNQLSTVFNFAVRYYDLKENPCKKTGSIGKNNADEMNIWTLDEFNQFIQSVEDPGYYTAFNILYYCGTRVGEVLALTLQDILFEEKFINIDKTYSRINGKDIISPPKTECSIRTIYIFDYLIDIIKDYVEKLYKPHSGDRLFPFTKNDLRNEMIRVCKKIGLQRIRIHDLRHSHCALLIDMGFGPAVIAERLGHENITTTLNTYGHLYPNRQAELADALQKKITEK